MREELEKAGMIRQIEPAAEVICNQCEERCLIIPELFTHPKTEEKVWLYVCPEKPDIGRIQVEPERRMRWEILPDRIEDYFRSTAPKKETLPPKSKITEEEANAAIRKLIPELKQKMGLKTEKDLKKITARLLADRIGCSIGLVSSCSAWKIFVKTRDKKQTTSSKTTRLNDAHLDTLSAHEQTPDEIAAAKELEQLVAEQKADMDNQDNKKNRIFPDR
jgi:hypothetical protein